MCLNFDLDEWARIMPLSSADALPYNILVKLAADGRKGTIVGSVLGRRLGEPVVAYVYDVVLADGGETVSVTRDEFEVVRPAKKRDKLIILRGDLKGQMGTLLGIDSADGIINVNSDIKILDLDYCDCAKLDDASPATAASKAAEAAVARAAFGAQNKRQRRELSELHERCGTCEDCGEPDTGYCRCTAP